MVTPRIGASGVLRVALALIAGSLCFMSMGCSDHPKAAQGGEGAATPGKASRESSSTVGVMHLTTLTDGTLLIGRISAEELEGFLMLEDVYFMSPAEEGEENNLRRFGTEIYRPQAETAIPLSSVLYLQPLSPGSKAVLAVEEYENKEPYEAADEGFLPDGAVGAVFLRDGQVFFGNIAVNADSVSVAGAHFLRYKDLEDVGSGIITSLDDIELVAQSTTPAGPSGEIEIPLTSVNYLQTLAKDSPVAVALAP